MKVGAVQPKTCRAATDGRETAKMLQFKINPVQLFDAK